MASDHRDGSPPGGPVGLAPQVPRWHKYDDVRTIVVRDVLRDVVAELTAASGRARLDIIDAGGGTGGFAVPLAGQGHLVTVIDPSPDSLAAAQRRAAEMAVPLHAVQGDASDLADLVGERSADLVLCHSVLEYVDSPAAAMAAIAAVLRPGGAASVLASSAVATVLHRAMAGRFDEARQLLAALETAGPGAAGTGAAGTGAGAASAEAAGAARAGTASAEAAGAGGLPAASFPRRFTLAGVVGLIEGAGLRPGAAHGVRVFADLVPGAFADADPGAADSLLALEQAASVQPAFHDLAAQFHVLGHR